MQVYLPVCEFVHVYIPKLIARSKVCYLRFDGLCCIIEYLFKYTGVSILHEQGTLLFCDRINTNRKCLQRWIKEINVGIITKKVIFTLIKNILVLIVVRILFNYLIVVYT